MAKIKKRVQSRGYPNRIVCLSADSADALFRLGVGHRIVGVSSYAKVPDRFRDIARISGFSIADCERILSLKPDLVIAYSYVQSRMVADLVKAGLSVLITQQLSLQGIEEMVMLLGRIVRREDHAHKLINDFQNRIPSSYRKNRPRVYMEEWPEGGEPQTMISGIGWVSELIEREGGVDIFSELRDCNVALEREVSSGEIIRKRSTDRFSELVRPSRIVGECLWATWLGQNCSNPISNSV